MNDEVNYIVTANKSWEKGNNDKTVGNLKQIFI
jgi:hypothetical protein